MKKFKFIIDGVIIVAFALLVCYAANRAGYWVYGGDGYSHATKIRFIADFWPNINWVYFWGNGIPVFLWYGFMPYLPLVLFYKLLSSAALAINAVNVLTFIMIGIGIWGIVYEVTKSRLAALLAAFLTLPSPGLWYRIAVSTTTRTFGDGWMILALWFLIRTLRQDKEKALRTSTWLGLVLLTGMAFQAHFFSVLITGIFALVIILVVADSWKRRIKFLALTFLPAFLLAAYFIFPYIITGTMTKASSLSGFYEAYPINLKLLFYVVPGRLAIGGGFLPVYLPLLVILLTAAFIRGKLKQADFAKRVVWAYVILFILFLAYGTAIFFGFPRTWYNIGFVPDEVFEFLSLIIPVLIGIGFWLNFSSRFSKFICLELLAVAVALVFWQYPLAFPLRAQTMNRYDAHAVYDNNLDWTKHLIWRFNEEHKNEKNYRYAHPSTEISLYFNFDFQIPQNREFFPHGVVYPNWRSWQENAIYGEKWLNKKEETKFLLDWFAIRWLTFVPPFLQDKTKYLEDSDYRLETFGLRQDQLNGVFNFEFPLATPILSSTNAPAILVIGEKDKDQSFGPLIRNLAALNLNSRYLIPVRGKNFVDDYQLSELGKFPLIFLYQHQIKSPQKAGKIIKDYLNQGGKVIIESTELVAKDKRKLFEKSLGFESQQREVTEGRWSFVPQENSLTQEVDFSTFALPLFENSPWKVLGIEKEVLGLDKEPILVNAGQVVIFKQKVGQGELLWSGLNLPYHAMAYDNRVEKEFLAKIIFNLLGTEAKAVSLPENTARFINPQQREVEIIGSARAVLFKENYFFNWHAYFQKDGKKTALKIFPAGLDFMYVVLPKVESSGKVVFYYRRSLMEKACTALSIATLLVLAGFPLAARSGKFKGLISGLKQKSLGQLSSWWRKEDEE